MISYKPILYGLLPIEIIVPILKENLEPGNVRLSARAHAHIARDHPEDYVFCLNNMACAIDSPTYVGKGPMHISNFELIKQV